MRVGDIVHYKNMADKGDYSSPFRIMVIVDSETVRLSNINYEKMTDSYKLHFIENLYLDKGEYVNLYIKIYFYFLIISLYL